MSLADELLADLDDVGDELGNEENDQVFFFCFAPEIVFTLYIKQVLQFLKIQIDV